MWIIISSVTTKRIKIEYIISKLVEEKPRMVEKNQSKKGKKEKKNKDGIVETT